MLIHLKSRLEDESLLEGREVIDIINPDIIEIDNLTQEVIVLVENKLRSTCGLQGKCIIVTDEMVIKMAWDIESIEMIRKEGLVWLQLAKLNNRHFAPIIQYGIVEDVDVLVYKRIHGLTLNDYMNKSPTHHIDTFVSIISHTFKGLYEAYNTMGYTHYDLHPDNIIITSEGIPVMIDYGLSYAASDPNTGTDFKAVKIKRETWWGYDAIKLLCNLYEIASVEINTASKKKKIYYQQRGSMNMVSIICNIPHTLEKYNLQGTIYDEYLEFPSKENESDARLRIKEDLLKKLDDKYQADLDEINNQKSLYNDMQVILESILSYFTVMIDNKIESSPSIYVPYLRSETAFIFVSKSETTGGSFEEFMGHLTLLGL